MKNAIIISIIVICALSFCALPAEATLITIEIEAVVDSVRDEGNYLEGQINPGDIITGYYTYESTTLDSNPSSPSIGRYEQSATLCGISVAINPPQTKPIFIRTNPANVEFLVEVGNDHPWFDPDINKDHYLVRSYNNLPLSNGTPVGSISWVLDDPTGSALSTDALPTMPPVLDDWQFNHLRLETLRAFSIDAHVTSAVPEPTSVLLFALGILLLRKRN